MVLPIDIVGAVWLSPTAIWEWELDPAVPPQAGIVDSLGGVTQPCEPEPQWRLVFKGYEYSATYNWTLADSLLSRPWQEEDDERRADRVRERLDAMPRPEDDPNRVR